MRAYQWLRPFLFALSPETAHHWALYACKLARLLPQSIRRTATHYECLETQIGKLHFANPLGLAAGWDKSGDATDALSRLNWGHFEIGSVSALPSLGNPRPRLWRLPQDEGLVVHYGLPNRGAIAVAKRLQKFRKRLRTSAPLVGVNIVKTNDRLARQPSPLDSIEDYLFSLQKLNGLADYFTLNLSCPNTDQQSDFFDDPRNLSDLLSAIESTVKIDCPLFLKISPTDSQTKLEELLCTVDPYRWVSGFQFNLPSGKPDWLNLSSSSKDTLSHPGAISGAPVREYQLDRLRQLAKLVPRGRYHLISAGGICSASDAYERICAGASLVQIYTALIYRGPSIIHEILEGLEHLIRRDGHANVADAIGSQLN